MWFFSFFLILYFFIMSKEPYYNSKSATSYVKPANMRLFSACPLDLPAIGPNSILSAAIFDKHETIEPYYVSNRKVSSLPPVLIDLFRYKFDDDLMDEDDDCVIASDDDIAVGKGFEICAPQVSIKRRVSDNYTVRNNCDTDSDDESEQETPSKINTIPTCKLRKTNPPDVNDLHNSTSVFQEKLDNPNVITNEKSRALSMSLAAPTITHEKNMVFEDIFQSMYHRYDVNDNYESRVNPYLI
jgi:hypothetical protein